MSDGANGHPRDLLSDYLDDELELVERGAIDRHLAACEDCREHLAALRRLAQAVACESVPPVPVDLAARIGRALDPVATPRRRTSRFVVPATIAATLGAIGLLVALQWREGRLGVPVSEAPSPERQVRDEVRPSDAPLSPPPPAVPEPSTRPIEDKKKAERRDAAEKDLAKTAAPKPMEGAKESAESVLVAPPPASGSEAGPDSDAGVASGVVGGVVGGVAGGVEQEKSADDARGRRAAARERNESSGFARPAPAPAAKAQALASCEEHWVDSGARGIWQVTDVAASSSALDQIARDVGGVGFARGLVDGRPYVLVVPRDRFEEVFFALRARGVTGLGEPPRLDVGTGCAGISIALEPRGSSPPPR